MKILLIHILRNIKENKFRSILIIMSLAISTMVMYLNLNVKDDIYTQYNAILHENLKKYDVSITADSSNEDNRFSIEQVNLEGMAVDDKIAMVKAYSIFDYEDEAVTVNMTGVDRQKMIDDELIILSDKSSDFDTEASNQIIISKKVSEYYNIPLGSEITLNTIDGKNTYKITGLADNKGIFIGEDTNFNTYLSESEVSRINKYDETKYSYYFLDIADSQNIKEAVEVFNSSNTICTAHEVIDSESIQNMLDMVSNMLLVVLLAVVLLNIFVVSSITKLIMAMRIPVIGTFRSVGATKLKMNLILIFENAVYGIIGASIGIILGLLLRTPLSRVFISAGDAFDNLKINLGFNIWYAVAAIAFSIALQIFVSLKAIIKSGRKSIKDTIFNTINTASRISKRHTITGLILLIASIVLYFANTKYSLELAGISILCAVLGTVYIIPFLTKYISKGLAFINGKLFGASAELGCKNLSGSKSIKSSIVLVTVVIAIIMMIYMMTLSIAKVFSPDDGTFGGEIYITSLMDKVEDYYYLKDLENVDEMNAFYYIYDTFEVGDKETDYCIVGTDEENHGIKDLSGKIGKLADGEAVIDKVFAIKQNIELGDTISLYSTNINAKTVSYKIVGYVDSMNFTTNRNVICINQAEYRKDIINMPNSISLALKEGTDINDMKKAVNIAMAGTRAEVTSVAEYLKRQEDSTNAILAMIEMMLAMSVIMSIFGLLNNQLIGFVQRKKELAVLYSVSMSKGQLKKMLFFEVLGTFVTACIIGSVLSIYLTILLEKLMFAIGICFDISINYLSLISMVLIIFVVLMFTVISPVHKLNKMDVVEQIKYE